MGYRPKRPTFKLVFEGSEYDGLEVRTSSPSLGQLQQVAAGAAQAESGTVSVEALDATLGLFAGLLVSWNVEDDDGAPVPTTLAGLQAQPAPFVISLMKAWAEQMAASTEVPGPLGETSTGGSLSGVPSIPLAASPSASQAS